ncbi:hypothetical protein AK830_g2179 [Neonectria ditissima]|uniref:Protein kinase domain-containing protein n=1 Tax=Neonectria ditissima TaxID=78410 RepID=A0A0P7BSR1_9HYPO|nr:hypothetical protein AK830_g2179 [Neonectria ditissima]
MAQADVTTPEPSPIRQPPTPSGTQTFFRKLFGRQTAGTTPATPAEQPSETEPDADPADAEKAGLIRRMSRRVVPNLPRTQTFKRQQSERRTNLAPVDPTLDERRAVSVDRRSQAPRASISHAHTDPRVSAPGFLGSPQDEAPQYADPVPLSPMSPLEHAPTDGTLEQVIAKDDEATLADECAIQDSLSNADTHSMTTSQYDAMIHDELERTWILNLSMHFRDRSRREKFFVTYREQEHLWRRVTISLDYRNAPLNSLEMDLIHTHYQRDKSAKIYEAIRESLRDIQFYDTVTNLKLQTTDGRLHVHVVEDGNEIIPYPSVSQIKHLGCKRIREQDIVFDSHMSGFVYKVKVNGQTLIKKEIPSPDTVEEFLYEVNALNRLRYSNNVIHFYGVVVDDDEENVKGLLISYADQGALIDIIYEHCKDGEFDLPWSTREKWARQIVEGLSDIHESGFVQGDFTLSNIVIDENGDAKIIDINRRGCPVGWEPPEATPLIDCNQRISMYIGVKSDLYQLGMVLWALAMQEDEPEAQGRPLILGPEVNIPDWYRQMAEICLSDEPRTRLQALSLLQMFPPQSNREDCGKLNPPPMSVDDDYTLQQYLVEDYLPDNHPQIRTVEPPSDWSYVSRPYADAGPTGYEPYYYTRGRSPPSPLPSNYDRCDDAGRPYDVAAWAANRNIPSSYSDVGLEDMSADETPIANKSALIKPHLPPALNPVVGEKVEISLTGKETGNADTYPSKPTEEPEPDNGTSTWTIEHIEPKEAKTSENFQGDRAADAPTVELSTDEIVEVVGDEHALATARALPTPLDIDRDHSSTKADSACDVVMPPEQAQKEDTKGNKKTKGEEGTPEMGVECPLKTNHVEESHAFANDTDGSHDAPKTTENVAKEQGSEVIHNKEIQAAEIQASEIQKPQAEPKLEKNAAQLQGITAPEPQQINTEASSRTVTPSKLHENEERKETQNSRLENGQTVRDGGVQEEENRGCDETGSIKVKSHDSLKGIGAVYLTNHDGDAIRHQQTIDDDLNVADPVLPDMTMKTDTKI